MLDRERDDLFPDLVRVSGAEFVLEIDDPCPGPEVIDGRQGRLARLDGLAVFAAVGETAGHFHAPAAEAEERRRGAAGEEIGHACGRGVRQLALDLHVGDQVRQVRITGLGDVGLVAHPLCAVLGAVARLGVVG